MTAKRSKWCITALSLGATLLLAARAQAGLLTNYDIAVNTTSIEGSAGYLDFQFNPGSGGTWDPASATLADFSTDGTLTGQDLLPDPGDVSGDLPGIVILDTDNNNSLNDDTEGFTFGSFFDVSVTFNIPTVSGSAAAGNSLFLTLYDSSFSNTLLANANPSPLVEIDLDAVTGAPSVINDSSDSQAQVQAPEPYSWLLIAAGLVGMMMRRRDLSAARQLWCVFRHNH